MQRVGVDIGGSKVLGVVLRDGEVVQTQRLATVHDRDALLASVRALVDGLDPSAPVGLGVAGFVSTTGAISSNPNVPVLAGLSAAELEDGVGRQVHVGNDANCAALAEWQLGAGAGVNDLTLLTLGTGIGAGFVVGGRLLTGGGGFAAEIGHMIVDPDGPPCPCGQHGCWERLASGGALDRAAQAAHDQGWLRRPDAPGAAATGADLIVATRSGDRRAADVLDTWSRWLALGVVNVVNLLDPEVLVLAGGLAAASDVILPRVVRWRDRLWNGTGSRQPPPLVAGRLGEPAGAIGAALLAATG